MEKRILLKISGEALEDKENHQSYDPQAMENAYRMAKQCVDRNVELAMVVGGGNIWRGNRSGVIGIDQATGDYMGMLATLMNAMALQGFMEKRGLMVRVMSALPVNACAEPYIRRRAIHHLEKGRIVIFACGVGSPFFTTDSGAALRAREINADSIFMGKNGVDGVYDADPRSNPDAKFLPHVTYQEVMDKKLAFMDLTAAGILAKSDIAIHVFNMADPTALGKILDGDKTVGTLVTK